MFKFCPFCGNKIDQQQKSGFQCSNCKKWTHYASSPAVSIAVKVGDKGLVAVRGIDPGKGELDLVGGFLKNGEDPLVGAVREFKEETGVSIDKGQLKLLGIWIDTYQYQEQIQWVLNIVYFLEVLEKFEMNPADDVAKLTWIPLSDTPKFAFNYLHEVWEKISG